MIDSRSVILFAVILVGLSCSVVAAGGASDYSITTATTIDTPERDVEVGGETFTVSSLGREQAGNQLTVDVEAPAGQDYDVYLYDANRNIIDTESMTGSGPATLDTDAVGPGSYLVAVYQDGSIQTVFPVVMAGYDVQTSPASSVTENAELTITVDLQEVVTTIDPSAVEIALVQGDTVLWRMNAVEQSSEYTLTTQITADPGSYALLVNVRGDQEVRDRKELLGVSDRHPITVTEAAAGGGGGGGGGGAGGGQTTETATPTPAPTTGTGEDTPAQTSTPASTPQQTDRPETSPTDQSTEAPSQTGTGTSGATTPSEQTPPPTQEPTDGQGPNGGLVLFVAILFAVGIGTRLRALMR